MESYSEAVSAREGNPSVRGCGYIFGGKSRECRSQQQGHGRTARKDDKVTIPSFLIVHPSAGLLLTWKEERSER